MLFVNEEVESLLVQTVCNSSPMESGISCGSEWLGLGGSVVKIYLQCRRHKSWGFNLWVEKMPWRKKWQPTPVFLPEKSHGQAKSWTQLSNWACVVGQSQWLFGVSTIVCNVYWRRKIVMSCYTRASHRRARMGMWEVYRAAGVNLRGHNSHLGEHCLRQGVTENTSSPITTAPGRYHSAPSSSCSFLFSFFFQFFLSLHSPWRSKSVHGIKGRKKKRERLCPSFP